LKYYLIEFNSVFDAARGIEVMNNYKMVKYIRDHHQGVLKFKIDEIDYKSLKQNHIGFEVLNDSDKRT
jgi:hypothetical protein